MELLQILIASFAWWLGLYLLARDPAKPVLRLAGLGLVAYALGLAANLASLDLWIVAHDPLWGVLWRRAAWLLLFGPAVCWTGALLYRLPDSMPRRAALLAGWRYGLLPLVAAGVVLGISTSFLVDFAPPGAAPADGAVALLSAPLAAAQPGPGYGGFAGLVLLALGSCLGLTGHAARRLRPTRPLAVLLVAGLFFGLSTGLLAWPLTAGWQGLTMLAVGIDLELLGLAIAGLDAVEEGETLRRDLARSFLATLFLGCVFAALPGVILAAAGGGGPGLPVVLWTTAALAAAVVVFAGPLQAALDRLVFHAARPLQQARTDLRITAEALARMDSTVLPLELDAAEFSRLTRQALRHYGDLPRLASNPLTRLPTVTARLHTSGGPGETLERAAHLKALLAESVARLKPRTGEDFGTTGEWRYYNALYFPYIRGLKPYNRRAETHPPDLSTAAALAWFHRAVPERTLYHWQATAADLVARDLCEHAQA